MQRTMTQHPTRSQAPRRGFRLLEVIIAVTIVALLATLVVPRLTRFLKGANEEEKDLEEIFLDLSTDMNIFSYIVPAFTPGPNIKALLAWNDISS